MFVPSVAEPDPVGLYHLAGTRSEISIVETDPTFYRGNIGFLKITFWELLTNKTSYGSIIRHQHQWYRCRNDIMITNLELHTKESGSRAWSKVKTQIRSYQIVQIRNTVDTWRNFEHKEHWTILTSNLFPARMFAPGYRRRFFLTSCWPQLFLYIAVLCPATGLL